MRVETVHIIGDLVRNWKIMLNINSVTLDGGNYILSVCNTYHLSGKHPNSNEGYTVVIDSIGYEVLDVVLNESITLKGGRLPVKGKFQIAPPHFYHGTVTQTNTELSLISDAFDKTPMIYLRRTFTETFENIESAIDRTPDLEMYWLTQSDFNGWITDDFDKYSVWPMRNSVYAFLEMVDRNRNIIGKLDTYRIIDAIKFATFNEKTGYEKAIWPINLSGCGLKWSPDIMKGSHCDC